mmetsp:Transcript_54748/g.114447  ORF Transcript_54748/g.114447 Transcript_54748/m.114447 type:complete len:215 (-) Transcript_54748:374-1018(-)
MVHPPLSGGDRPDRHFHLQLEVDACGALAHSGHRRVHVLARLLHEDSHRARADRPRRRWLQGRRDAFQHSNCPLVRDGGEGDQPLRRQDQHLLPYHQAARLDRRRPLLHHQPRRRLLHPRRHVVRRPAHLPEPDVGRRPRLLHALRPPVRLRLLLPHLHLPPVHGGHRRLWPHLRAPRPRPRRQLRRRIHRPQRHRGAHQVPGRPFPLPVPPQD